MIIFGSFLPSLLVGLAPPIYSDLGADIVYGIITHIIPCQERVSWRLARASDWSNALRFADRGSARRPLSTEVPRAPPRRVAGRVRTRRDRSSRGCSGVRDEFRMPCPRRTPRTETLRKSSSSRIRELARRRRQPTTDTAIPRPVADGGSRGNLRPLYRDRSSPTRVEQREPARGSLPG